MKPVILYRGIEFERDEKEAFFFFPCTNIRPSIQKGDLIIGRYSMLPYYAEQVKDFEYVGASVINTYSQHLYVADLQNYVADLRELTPKTWSNLQDIPEVGPFVLKGETNSRKHNWKHDMFAENKKQAIEISNRLSNDGLIGSQKIFIRQYIPLITYMNGVNDMPVTKEFRFFVAYGQVVCGDYYWQSYVDDLPAKPDPNDVPRDFLQKVIDRVDGQCNFYTIDVGQTVSGDWIVIELNDGQQAGLSCIDPMVLYSGLRDILKAKGMEL